MFQAAFQAALLNLFGGVYVPAGTKYGANLGLLRRGVVAPDGLPEDAARAVEAYAADLVGMSSTFHVDPGRVEAADESDLKVAQLLHYLSTYGAVEWLRNNGSVFTLNPLSPQVVKTLRGEVVPHLKIVEVLTLAEVEDRVRRLLNGGTAVESATLVALLEGLFAAGGYLSKEVSNKEARAYLLLHGNESLESVEDLVRVGVYAITGQVQVVKNDALYKALQQPVNDTVRQLLSQKVTDFGFPGDSSRQTPRYARVLVLLRKHLTPEAKALVNKALKQGRQRGSSFKEAGVNRMFDPSVPVDVREGVARSLSASQAVRLLEANANRLLVNASNLKVVSYRIRNSKTFTKEVKGDLQVLPRSVDDILQEVVASAFRGAYAGKTVYIPNGVDYTVPSSLKNMVGSFPEGTMFTVEGAASVGVYWDTEADIDLHGVTAEGERVGWNTQVRGDHMIYSGDMTALNQEGWACEYIGFTGPASCSVSTHVYNGPQDIDCRLVVTPRPADGSGWFSGLSGAFHQVPLKARGGALPSLFARCTGERVSVSLVGASASAAGRVPGLEASLVRAQLNERQALSRVYLRDVLHRSGVKVVDTWEEGCVDMSPEVFKVDMVMPW